MADKEKQEGRSVNKLMMKGILLLNAAWLASMFMFGMMKEGSDVNAAGMYLVVAIPHLILFNILNYFLVPALVAIYSMKKKIQVLVIVCLLAIAILVIQQSPWMVLMEIWIGVTFLIDLWIITHPQAQIK